MDCNLPKSVLSSAPVEVKNGLSNYIPGDELEGRLTRGETPLTPSYKDTKVDVNILSAVAGANQDEAIKVSMIMN